jgi:hypothetical protein
MLSRRELITAGVAGGLSASSDAASLQPFEEQQVADRDGQREIKRSIDNVEAALRSGMLTNSLSHGVVGKVRGNMEQFFRSNAKFPDFIDIGYTVFIDLYDWHVKNHQQLMVTRATDGRYWMQFMFTTLVLRGEVDPAYVGLPYDKA